MTSTDAPERCAAEPHEPAGARGAGVVASEDAAGALIQTIRRRTEKRRLWTLAVGTLVAGCCAGVAMDVFHSSGAGALFGMGIAVAQVLWMVNARRYRNELRRELAALSPEQRVSLLEVLAADGETQFLTRSLVKEPGRESRQLVPADPPAGRGDEVTPGG